MSLGMSAALAMCITWILLRLDTDLIGVSTNLCEFVEDSISCWHRVRPSQRAHFVEEFQQCSNPNLNPWGASPRASRLISSSLLPILLRSLHILAHSVRIWRHCVWCSPTSSPRFLPSSPHLNGSHFRFQSSCQTHPKRILLLLSSKDWILRNGQGRSDIGGAIWQQHKFFLCFLSVHDAIVEIVVGATVGVDLTDAMVGRSNGSKGHFTHETESPWPSHFKHSRRWKRRSRSKFAASHYARGTNGVMWMQDGCRSLHGILHGIEWIMFHGHLDYF